MPNLVEIGQTVAEDSAPSNIMGWIRLYLYFCGLDSCCVFIMVAQWNRADHYIYIIILYIIISYYIFMLWFVLLSSFFSSPNLSHRRLDVCHTSTYGVALLQI